MTLLKEMYNTTKLVEVIGGEERGITRHTLEGWIRRHREGLMRCGALLRVGGRWYWHQGRLEEWLERGSQREAS